MQIQQIQWKRSPVGDASGTFNSFKIYMGYGSSDQLGANYLNNYIAGTRTLVFSRSAYSVSASAGQWFSTTLDTPFFYNGSNNLIIECEWSSATPNSIYIWHWTAGNNRGIYGPYGQATADNFEDHIPHFIFTGLLGLEQETFGSIKTSFDE